MAYGQTDVIVALEKDLDETLNLLVAVAKGTKDVSDVQAWLEKKYPELCYDTQPAIKKW